MSRQELIEQLLKEVEKVGKKVIIPVHAHEYMHYCMDNLNIGKREHPNRCISCEEKCLSYRIFDGLYKLQEEVEAEMTKYDKPPPCPHRTKEEEERLEQEVQEEKKECPCEFCVATRERERRQRERLN